ncbi:MAG: hypothetical protein K0Q51_1517 [Rickettsiaceae bacterium]|jgi:hypothetical protein|nr:hypothetical protein [Rickettsiaceae bacterium]
MSKENMMDFGNLIQMAHGIFDDAKKRRENREPRENDYARRNIHVFYYSLQKFKETNPQEYKNHQKLFDRAVKESEYVVSYAVDACFSKNEELKRMLPSELKEEEFKIDKEFQDAQKNLEKLLKKEPKKVAKAIYESSKADSVVRDDESNERIQTMLGLSPALTYKAALISERIDELKARDETGEKKTKQPKTFKQKLQSFCKAIGRLITRKHIVKDEDLRKALEDFEKLKGLKKKYQLGNNKTTQDTTRIFGPFTERLVSSSSKSEPGHSK